VTESEAPAEPPSVASCATVAADSAAAGAGCAFTSSAGSVVTREAEDDAQGFIAGSTASDAGWPATRRLAETTSPAPQ
jgi:hypothetical protein